MYKSLEEIAQVSKQKNIPFWQVILEDDCKERMVSPEQSKKELMAMYQAMKEADAAYDAKQKSRSGMVGGNGQLFHDAVVSGKTICGPVIASAIEKALKMGESNACMKRIVAAPTAGACGVVPAVYLTSGRDWFCKFHGSSRSCLPCRRRHRGNHPCSSYGNEKSAWPCM